MAKTDAAPMRLINPNSSFKFSPPKSVTIRGNLGMSVREAFSTVNLALGKTAKGPKNRSKMALEERKDRLAHLRGL